jgi:hypothetical protein
MSLYIIVANPNQTAIPSLISAPVLNSGIETISKLTKHIIEYAITKKVNIKAKDAKIAIPNLLKKSILILHDTYISTY